MTTAAVIGHVPGSTSQIGTDSAKDQCEKPEGRSHLQKVMHGC
jgi:hypothetical protein